jgi:hypothetical protein
MKITSEQASAMRRAYEAASGPMEEVMRATAAVLPEPDPRQPSSTDEEIDAMRAVLEAVDTLEGAAQSRVLGYVCERLGLRGPWSE